MLNEIIWTKNKMLVNGKFLNLYGRGDQILRKKNQSYALIKFVLAEYEVILSS